VQGGQQYRSFPFSKDSLSCLSCKFCNSISIPPSPFLLCPLLPLFLFISRSPPLYFPPLYAFSLLFTFLSLFHLYLPMSPSSPHLYRCPSLFFLSLNNMHTLILPQNVRKCSQHMQISFTQIFGIALSIFLSFSPPLFLSPPLSPPLFSPPHKRDKHPPITRAYTYAF
jgi:hypothetical protein